MEKIKVIYQDQDLLVIDKPSGFVVFSEKEKETVMTMLLDQFPELKKVGKGPRYGMVHRLDRETSGLLLIAKNKKAFIHFQKQFKKRKVVKKYIALVFGNIKQNSGIIKTLIGRSSKDRTKKRAYSLFSSGSDKKRAISQYEVLKRFSNNKKRYTLLEVEIKTGRTHQIRVHLQYLGHPIVGDKDYKFRKQPLEIKRHFLHAQFLKISLLDGRIKEFHSEIPQYLNDYLKTLNEIIE